MGKGGQKAPIMQAQQTIWYMNWRKLSDMYTELGNYQLLGAVR